MYGISQLLLCQKREESCGFLENHVFFHSDFFKGTIICIIAEYFVSLI